MIIMMTMEKKKEEEVKTMIFSSLVKKPGY